MFLTTVPKRLEGGSWNLVTFNINLFSIKKVIFGSPGYPALPWQRVCQGVLEIFWSYRSHMFPYNEILKVFKSKIWVDIWRKHFKIPPNTKFQWNQSRGIGSYKHLKFRSMRRLKYRLWRHNDIIVVTSQIFCYHCVEYIKLDTCAKFYDHRSNNHKVMIGGPHGPPMTDGSKKAHVK